MDIVAILERFWASLSASLGGDALSILIVVAFAAVMVALYFGVTAFRRTEFYRQNKALLELVDDHIVNLVFLIGVGNVDLTPYEQKAEEREAAGLFYVDPRMLYLLDKAQDYAKREYNVELDFEDLLARAERIYDEVRNDPANSIPPPAEPA